MNIPLGSSSEEEEEEEEVDIKYVVGDVTLPQCRGNEDAIVVHCVGKVSGQSDVHADIRAKCFNLGWRFVF